MSTLSSQGVKAALQEADKFRSIKMAEREYNIHYNDGMTLQIPQDNLIDWFVNTFDSHRITLEKKAEILHDYYGDRLLAKELFQRYLSYKTITGGAANLLTLGLLGANVYSRVFRNSVLMGKVGTLTTIVGLQIAGRSFSNSFLENEIERPWKIHCNRMAKGLGPTNIPSNYHSELITTPLRFYSFAFNPKDMLFGSKVKYGPSNLSIKFPLPQEHYPYAPDEHDLNKLLQFETQTNRRFEMTQPEDDGETIFIPADAHMDYKFNNEKYFKPRYFQEFEMFKGFLMNGDQTIYVPDNTVKRVAFEPKKIEHLIKNKFIEENDYAENPLTAQINADLPLYSKMFEKDVNITKERIDTLKHHYLQRIKFKNLKKQLNDELKNTINVDEAQNKMHNFYDEIKKDDIEYLKKNVNIAAPDVEANFLDQKKNILLFDSDKQALKDYFDYVVSTRPQMFKEKTYEPSYDWDFEVDIDNYDPWTEYKLIYRDLFAKGRKYFILRSIPEWRFLQIGRAQGIEDETVSKTNPIRFNTRDSIFNILTQDRYFHERMTKEGRYKGRSASIRI